MPELKYRERGLHQTKYSFMTEVIISQKAHSLGLTCSVESKTNVELTKVCVDHRLAFFFKKV